MPPIINSSCSDCDDTGARARSNSQRLRIRAQFVTFTPEELKALDVKSSKLIDLEKFVPQGDLDPVYLDTPYYLYPDGPVAEETLGVISEAMAEAGVVGGMST